MTQAFTNENSKENTSMVQEINLAEQTVSEMGVGWNLGNTLDAYSKTVDSYEISQQKRDKYKLWLLTLRRIIADGMHHKHPI